MHFSHQTNIRVEIRIVREIWKIREQESLKNYTYENNAIFFNF